MASLLAKYSAKRRWFMVCFLMMSLTGGTYILRGNSETRSGISQGHASVNVFNVESAGGDEYRSQVYGMTTAPQNPENGKNTIKSLQPAKVESHTLMGRGLTGRQGENLWEGERKQFNKKLYIQRSAPVMESAIKGRRLLEAQKNKPHAVDATESVEPNRPMPYTGPPAEHN